MKKDNLYKLLAIAILAITLVVSLDVFAEEPKHKVSDATISEYYAAIVGEYMLVNREMKKMGTTRMEYYKKYSRKLGTIHCAQLLDDIENMKLRKDKALFCAIHFFETEVRNESKTDTK